jgi:hypothetical protein
MGFFSLRTCPGFVGGTTSEICEVVEDEAEDEDEDEEEGTGLYGISVNVSDVS